MLPHKEKGNGVLRRILRGSNLRKCTKDEVNVVLLGNGASTLFPCAVTNDACVELEIAGQ